jgi:hypothetical protein
MVCTRRLGWVFARAPHSIGSFCTVDTSQTEDQVAQKGNAQLRGIHGCRELVAEYAHLDEP